MAKKALWVLLIAAIATEILNVLMYWMADAMGISDSIPFLTYTNCVIVTWAVLSMICFALTLGSFGLKSPPGKVWLCLTIGLVSWTIADIFYLYFQVIAVLPDELLFPTIADYFWSLGYVFMFIGIFLQMRLAAVKMVKKEAILVVIVVAVTSILAVGYVIWPVLVEDLLSAENSWEYWLFSLDYPILDLILIPMALILALKYRGGEFSKAWLIIAVGFIVTAIYDLLYTYFENLGAGYILYTDIIYLGYYMLLGIGALYLRASVRSIK